MIDETYDGCRVRGGGEGEFSDGDAGRVREQVYSDAGESEGIGEGFRGGVGIMSSGLAGEAV